MGEKTMGEFPEPDALLIKADEIINESDKRNLTLRLIGALAFHKHCPTYGYIQKKTNRVFTDIDFMAYIEQKRDIDRVFLDLGYVDDKRIQTVPGVKRSIFFTSDNTLHSDVFYDTLDFSHIINFRGRLELDYPTVSLVDLLLEKMQIAQINEKDIIDTIMLVREHDVGSSDDETINIDYIAKICKSDWGLWKTVTTNLDKVMRLIDKYDVLTNNDQQIIRERFRRIVRRIDEEPATLRWKLRSKVGERVKWYRDVDEVM
jgi:hypothetical protein